MPLPSFMTESDIEMLGLRLMLLVVACQNHDYGIKIWKKPPTYNYSICNLDLLILKSNKIYDFISKPIFMSYSSIVICINCCHFPCRARSLRTIIKAIENNQTLRYKIKVICTFYQSKENSVSQRHEMFVDFFSFQLSQLENTFLFQDCHCRSGDLMIQNLLKIVECRPFISVQELELIIQNFCAILTTRKTNVELYFYSINPALAIIVNNYYFTNHMGIRVGSEQNVHELIREFKRIRTPYILIEDITRAQLLNLVKYLRYKNLEQLECLYFITMTHGAENDILYTNDGELNFVEDILRPIQSNVTLKETNILFVNNYCRGELNGLYITHDDSKKILPTQIQQLQPNTSVIYSVPDTVISPRHPQNGALFINKFTRSFRDLKSPSSLNNLFENVVDSLQNDHYYDTLDCFGKAPELVMGDTTKSHNIKPMATNAKETAPLFVSITKDFQQVTQSPSTSYCLYGNVSENKLQTYSNQQIDDHSAEFQTELDEEEKRRILQFYDVEKEAFKFVRSKKYDKYLNRMGKIKQGDRINSSSAYAKKMHKTLFVVPYYKQKSYLEELEDETYFTDNCSKILAEEGKKSYELESTLFEKRALLLLKDYRYKTERSRKISNEECFSNSVLNHPTRKSTSRNTFEKSYYLKK
ncbi:uncharacterized protein LOC135963391 [Calliphora vicina]|uniref:uncharacterized protein LOC135963391 n=1 Tax=Calliphora vicina TaxID=7373 RepID=UPI00325B8D30